MTSVGLSSFWMTLATVKVLPETGHTEQCLMAVSCLDRFQQLGDSLSPDRREV
jgi:hypothetical protein